MGKKLNLMIIVWMMILNTNHQSIIKRIKIWRSGMKKKISFLLIKWITKKKESLKWNLIKSIPSSQSFSKVRSLFIMMIRMINLKD